MGDRPVGKEVWRFGYADRFTIFGGMCGDAFMLLDDVAIVRQVRPPETCDHVNDCDCDPYAGFVGLYRSRAAARRTARKIERADGNCAVWHCDARHVGDESHAQVRYESGML